MTQTATLSQMYQRILATSLASSGICVRETEVSASVQNTVDGAAADQTVDENNEGSETGDHLLHARSLVELLCSWSVSGLL